MILFVCLIIVGFCIIGAHLLMIRKFRKCSEELMELKNDVSLVRGYYVSVIRAVSEYNSDRSSRIDEMNDRIDDIEKVINCPLINYKHKKE